MGTKNNPKNRTKVIKKREYNGKEIEPIFYYGKHSGHGNYMAARYIGTNDLALDEKQAPLPWKKVA